MGYISLPSILNAIIRITSYYCVILKIVILHDGIKTIQNRAFRFSFKKEQILVYWKKIKKTGLLKKTKKTGGLGFLEKTLFFSQPWLHMLLKQGPLFHDRPHYIMRSFVKKNIIWHTFLLSPDRVFSKLFGTNFNTVFKVLKLVGSFSLFTH